MAHDDDLLQKMITNIRGNLALVAPASTSERVEREPAPEVPRWLRSIPAEYAWARLDAPELRERVKIHSELALLSQSIVASPRVTFVGGAGSGKTVLAVACFRAWCERNTRLAQRSLFVLASRLAGERARHGLGHGEPPLVERCLRAPLLVLDDLGNGGKTTDREIIDVIFERHAESRATWITTGLSVSNIATQYGDGLVRRAFERGRVQVVKLGER